MVLNDMCGDRIDDVNRSIQVVYNEHRVTIAKEPWLCYTNIGDREDA
jgi:hypothetical protein